MLSILRRSIIFQILSFLIFSFVNVSVIYATLKKDDKLNNMPRSYYYGEIQKIFDFIEQGYVTEPKLLDVTDGAIDGMLKSLDPHSGYYTDEILEALLNDTEGEFGGIGVEIMYERGAIKVISPIDDLPAYNAGIRAGDYIVGVDGDLVSKLGFNKAVTAMRGKPDTKVSLLVIKKDELKPKELELKRSIVKIDPIKHEIEKDDIIGDVLYVRVVAFNQHTFEKLKNVFLDLEKDNKNNNLKGVILDLRNNPGGILDQAVFMSEYFIDNGTVVKLKSRHDEREIIADPSVAKAPNVPLIVLVNEGSASASEIVAGALQDHGRAIIMGTKSFGKGSVQTLTKINERAAVKLTIQKYYTPSGRSIDKKGIIPDIFVDYAKVDYFEEENENSIYSDKKVKKYLDKYDNCLQKNDDKSDKKDIDNNAEDNDLDDICNQDDMKKYKMSDKYKKDYQYARAYDLIRGLIISQDASNKKIMDENKESNNN